MKTKRPLDANSGAARVVLDASSLSIFQERRRGPGRPKRHIPEELFSWRDRLVWFLESNWPELEPRLRRARTAHDVRQALEPYKVAAPAPYLLAHGEKLSEFLSSGRYRGDPRQIANAMAGVDTLSWRRSLDLCSAPDNRCTLMVHERAWRDLMRRKFPDRFLLLRRAEKLDEPAAIKKISTIMRGTRTRDENIRLRRNRPEEVLRLLRSGIPNPPKSS